MYAKYFKRIIDVTLSLIALVVLTPVLLLLTVLGTVKMKGNYVGRAKETGFMKNLIECVDGNYVGISL